MTFSNLFSEISLLGSSLCSLQFSKVCVERMILRQVIGNAYKNWLEICCFHQNKKKAFTLEQLSVKDTHPFILNLLTPEKKSIEQHFVTWKNAEKYFLFRVVNTLYPCLQTKLNIPGWPKIVFWHLREDISGQYFWDKCYRLKFLVHITFIPTSPANTMILRLWQLNAINLLGKKKRDLGLSDISGNATDVWINLSGNTSRNPVPKAVKYLVFKASVAFGRRQFCPEHSNIWPKWVILGGQTAFAKLFPLSCQTSGVLQVLLMLKAFCLD